MVFETAEEKEGKIRLVETGIRSAELLDEDEIHRIYKKCRTPAIVNRRKHIYTLVFFAHIAEKHGIFFAKFAMTIIEPTLDLKE